MKLTDYDSTPFHIWRKFPIGNLKFPICFKVGIDFSRLDENSWKKSDLLSLKKASMTCHPMEQCHSPKKILGPFFGFEDFKINLSFNPVCPVFILFQTDFLFWKIYSLAENQTIVRTMTRIPNFCPETKRLYLPFYFSVM